MLLCLMAHVALVRGEAAEALDLAGRAFARNPNFDPSLWILTASLAHLGRIDDARRYAAMLEAMNPGITVAASATASPPRTRPASPRFSPASASPACRIEQALQLFIPG